MHKDSVKRKRLTLLSLSGLIASVVFIAFSLRGVLLTHELAADNGGGFGSYDVYCSTSLLSWIIPLIAATAFLFLYKKNLPKEWGSFIWGTTAFLAFNLVLVVGVKANPAGLIIIDWFFFLFAASSLLCIKKLKNKFWTREGFKEQALACFIGLVISAVILMISVTVFSDQFWFIQC